MYLREMGSVELLSREGEIAIAKRIEAGRELMIGALCEGPLTFEALTVWRDELNEGKALLRDIIDLEAMYGGGPGNGQPAAVPAAGRSRRAGRSTSAAAPNGAAAPRLPPMHRRQPRRPPPAAAAAARRKAAPTPNGEGGEKPEGGEGGDGIPGDGRRFRRREQSVALGDGSGAEAASARHARPDRRPL